MRKLFLFKTTTQTFTVGSALVVRWLGTGVQFILNVILGHLLGTDGVGEYYLYISSQNLLSNLGSGGFPQYTLREVASLDGDERGAKIRRLVQKSFLISLIFSFVLLALTLSFSAPLSGWLLGKGDHYYILVFAVIGATFLIPTKVLTGALKGKGHPNLALGLENSAAPTGLLLFVGLSIGLSVTLSIHLVLIGHVLLLAIVFLIAAFYWGQMHYRHFPGQFQNEKSPEIQIKKRSLFSFWGLTLLNNAYHTVPILLLPHFASMGQVGQFGVSQRLVTLASVILVVLNTIYSPRFARHYVQKDKEALQKDLKESQKYSLLIYLPFVAVFLLFSKPILTVFGSGFAGGSMFLWILSVGQLINASTGLVGNFLNMTNREGLEMKLSIIFVVFMIVLIIIFGDLYGAIGVASAYAFTVAAKNGTTYLFVKSLLGKLRNI